MPATPNTVATLGNIVPPQTVTEQLERILVSGAFSQAPMLSRLLRYVVEQTLAGKAAELKEYTVGVEVFGRGPAFDPRTDTIVRVQARRLRSRLEEYYKERQADPVRISIPKGAYAVQFELTAVRDERSKLHVLPACETQAGAIEGTSAGQSGAEPRWLPVPHTSLIGRDKEVAAVIGLLLSDSSRLLTLTGVGGSGKTRLALQAASQVSEYFAGGVYFAPLASVTDAGTVAATLAQILGVRRTGGDHLHEVVQSPTLLVVDNFEQVVSAGPLLVQLLEATSHLRILVTSRAVLRVYGEREYPVLPLSTPDPGNLPPLQQLAGFPAIRLFVERAAAIDAGFCLDESNAAAVAELCWRLDGLPLAIELAAARARVLGPAAMLARMEHPLELLTRGPEGQAARQQTLRNTIDWSHALLTPGEQKLFRRVAVFAGGCTLEAAEAVCNTRRDLDIDVLEGMASLTDKSLLKPSRSDDGETRFVTLETIRDYGLQRLAECGEEGGVRQAHAAYLLVVAEEGNAELCREDRQRWLMLCDREQENFRVAHDWLITSGLREWALRLALALYWYWERREYLAEGRGRLLTVVRMHAGEPPTRRLATAVAFAAALANSQGDHEAARREHQQSLELYREIGDPNGVAAQLSALGTTMQFQGDLEAASAWFEQTIDAFRELGMQLETAIAISNLALVLNARGERARARSLLHEALSVFAACGQPVNVAWSFNRLGDVSRDSGELAEAHDLYVRGLDLFRKYDDLWGIGRSMTDLGYLAIAQREPESARVSFREAAAAFTALGHNRGVAKALEGLACLAVHEAQFERALTLAGAATGLRRKIGAPRRHGEQSALDRSLDPAWRAVDAAQADAAWKAGTAMPADRAVEYAVARARARTTPLTGN